MIHQERIHSLNEKGIRKGRYVLYWMQKAQRANWNHALQYAVREANRLGQPLVVLFVLVPRFPEASRNHYRFMLEGLLETGETLESRGIRFTIGTGNPRDVVAEMAADASLVVTDCDYLKLQRQWRREVAGSLAARFVEIESDVVVPVGTASSKEEWSAATIRKKIGPLCSTYLVGLEEIAPKKNAEFLGIEAGSRPIEYYLRQVRPDPAGPWRLPWKGGEAAAHGILGEFLGGKIDRYEHERNDPNADVLSGLSPYLHFGQISPLEVALRARESGSPGATAFLEELVVRRELAANFIRFNPAYDSYAGLPEWARKTLAHHAGDRHENSYTYRELVTAATDDPLWNAAQTEMVLTGKMHGYLRMYWGKRIIGWSETPEAAFYTALLLNNRYELDGRDPNGYAGVAWCFGKHDRPMPEHQVFGMVRSMTPGGLQRKFDTGRYLERIHALDGGAGRDPPSRA